MELSRRYQRNMGRGGKRIEMMEEKKSKRKPFFFQRRTSLFVLAVLLNFALLATAENEKEELLVSQNGNGGVQRRLAVSVPAQSASTTTTPITRERIFEDDTTSQQTGLPLKKTIDENDVATAHPIWKQKLLDSVDEQKHQEEGQAPVEQEEVIPEHERVEAVVREGGQCTLQERALMFEGVPVHLEQQSVAFPTSDEREPRNRFFYITFTCGVKSIGLEGMTTRCIIKKLLEEGIPFEIVCAKCFGRVAQCVAINCLRRCWSEPFGDDCLICTDHYCKGDLTQCTGFVTPSPVVMKGDGYLIPPAARI